MIAAGIAAIIAIGWFLMLVMIAIFIACSIIFTINLVKCIRFKWQTRYLVPFIITGAIITLMSLYVIETLLEYAFTPKVPTGGSSASSIETVITYLVTVI